MSNERVLLLQILTVFGVVSISDFGHAAKCTVVSCFILYFLDDIRCGAFFSMFISHRYVLFSHVSIKVFSPFFNIVLFFLLGFKSSLQILGNSSLTDMFFAIISYQSVDCLILLTLTLAKQKFLILMKSSFPIFSFMDHAIGATF